MPLMGPLADFSGISRDLVITAYQSASGWINLFAPTAAHLVAGLALARIPYDRFVRWVLPFIVGVALITMGCWWPVPCCTADGTSHDRQQKAPEGAFFMSLAYCL